MEIIVAFGQGKLAVASSNPSALQRSVMKILFPPPPKIGPDVKLLHGVLVRR